MAEKIGKLTNVTKTHAPVGYEITLTSAEVQALQKMYRMSGPGRNGEDFDIRYYLHAIVVNHIYEQGIVIN